MFLIFGTKEVEEENEEDSDGKLTIIL